MFSPARHHFGELQLAAPEREVLVLERVSSRSSRRKAGCRGTAGPLRHVAARQEREEQANAGYRPLANASRPCGTERLLALMTKGDDLFNARDWRAFDAVHHPDMIAHVTGSSEPI